jgi:hypothetical protein
VPTREHQWLVLWVARAMARDGYRIEAYDGPTPQGGVWNQLSRPADVGGFRPDVFGLSPERRVAIGEAKSKNDVLNGHAVAQFAWFARCASWKASPLDLYIAVPQSAVHTLDAALGRARLLTNKRVHRIHVPDVLLHDEITHEAS